MSDNVALGKDCAQVTTYNTQTADKAVDGSTSTHSQTGFPPYGQARWWKVDLGAIYDIAEIQFVKYYVTRPNNYYIQTADDYAFTINVVTIITEINDETAGGETISWNTDDFGSVSTRYIRILTISTTRQYLSIKEFIVYENTVEPTIFYFNNSSPTDLSTVYGTTQQLYLTTTVSGSDPNYIYDADFYNAYDDSLINTSSGIQSGQPAGAVMSTPSGINYQWYVTATSSGYNDTSDTYTFINRFLCEGQTQINDVPASGIPVRLYRRSTGEYIGGVISSGVSGTFEIETTHNDYHFVVANYFNENTNAIIVDFLKP